jgi:hypothetical protein
MRMVTVPGCRRGVTSMSGLCQNRVADQPALVADALWHLCQNGVASVYYITTVGLAGTVVLSTASDRPGRRGRPAVYQRGVIDLHHRTPSATRACVRTKRNLGTSGYIARRAERARLPFVYELQTARSLTSVQ